MRGLMAKPSGEIIETPITANFREGLTVLQYFISTHGARKGLADTALKTADSGYLTRRLVDVAQDMIVTETDCGTLNGIWVTPLIEGGEIMQPLRDRILGRVPLEDAADPFTGEALARANEEIVELLASKIENAGIDRIRIRSVLTCEARRGCCIKCYGRNLATGRLVELGEAVGVLAAQSIGEPGTQLTMRTFHIGGTATRGTEQTQLESKLAGTVRLLNLKTVKTAGGDLVVMNRNGTIAIVDDKGRTKDAYQPVYGARLKVEDAQPVVPGQILVEWDPFTTSILTEHSGTVHFRDVTDGTTMKEEVDEVTGLSQKVIVEHGTKADLQPRISIKDAAGATVFKSQLPVGAHLMVADGQSVAAGDAVAKIPRETTKTKDITGGLPRVAELFEARKPKDPATISEIDGRVEFAGIVKGLRKIVIRGEEADFKEYLIPRGKHVTVLEGDEIKAGDPLMDGSIDPHDILHVKGVEALQKYLVNEVQEVYRLQGVNINDKHIEVIVRQMLRRVRIEGVGNTNFLLGEHVDRALFEEENRRVARHGRAHAPGDHQGLPQHRQLRVGRLVPGDDEGPHRGQHYRRAGRATRAEGERDHGPPDPGGHGHAMVSGDPHRHPRSAPGAARGGRDGRSPGGGGRDPAGHGRQSAVRCGNHQNPLDKLGRTAYTPPVISETKTGRHADHHATRPPRAAAASQEREDAGAAGLPAEAGGVRPRLHHDPEEAELGPAQGGPRAADQRDRSHHLHPRGRA